MPGQWLYSSTNTRHMLLNTDMDLDASPLPSRPLLSQAVLRLLADKNKPLSNSEIIREIGIEFGIDNSKRPPKSPKDGRSDFAYQLAWIRSDLKKKELVNLLNDGRWEISNIGKMSIS